MILGNTGGTKYNSLHHILATHSSGTYSTRSQYFPQEHCHIQKEE